MTRSLTQLMCIVRSQEEELVVVTNSFPKTSLEAEAMGYFPPVRGQLVMPSEESESTGSTDLHKVLRDEKTDAGSHPRGPPQIISLKDLMGVSTDDLTRATSGHFTPT